MASFKHARSSLMDDVEEKGPDAVKARYGNKRRAISMIVEEALKNILEEDEPFLL
jgi:hypothetical protein